MAKYSIGGRPKGKTNEKIPWAMIMAEYFTGGVRIKDLAKKYGIHPNTITKKKAKEDWDTQAKELHMNMAQEINHAALETIMEDETARIKRINEKHERIADMLVDFTANHIEQLRDKGVTWFNKETGKPYNEDAIVISPLQSVADVANKFVHNVKNAVTLQRMVLKLDKGHVDEAQGDMVIEFITAQPPEPTDDKDVDNVIDLDSRRASND